tara:strand:- start:5013 stop:5744 length:732 start_codon:yes stop_codon:yes gene_type:complete
MITLYQFKHSAFCLKTRMALHAKKLNYRVEEVKPGIGQIEIFQISGQKQLPVLMDDNNQIINDSSNICEYIDKKNNNNPLFPKDPMHFIQSKMIEDWADTTMASFCKKALIKSALENPKLRSALLPEDSPRTIKGIMDNIPFKNFNKISNIILSNKNNLEFQKILESLSKSLVNEKFIIGDQLSIADISIASQLSLLKFPDSSGPTLTGEGCQEFINNPYLENLFIWRDNIEKYLFSASSQDI